jgi:hypothetical protein
MARGKKNRGSAAASGKAPKRLGRDARSTDEILADALVRVGRRPPPLTEEEQAAQAAERARQSREWERQHFILSRERNPVARFRYRKGELQFQRLGYLNAVRQDRGRYGVRAPERRGLWAFPWPAGDIGFFAGHKWNEVLPKDLTEEAIAALRERYDALREAPDETAEVALLDAEIDARWERREAWIREQGPKVMPVRRFWYGGDLYSRLTVTGDFSSYSGDWTKMTVSQFYEAAKKAPVGYGTDHFEVFIPRL